MALQIQLRRGTAAQWTAGNPVLAQGELGLELDTKKFKFGDGVTAWNSLAYGNSLGTMSDVIISNPDDGSVLIYNGSINKWIASTTLDKQNVDGGFY